jgi:hypothetical protein
MVERTQWQLSNLKDLLWWASAALCIISLGTSPVRRRQVDKRFSSVTISYPVSSICLIFEWFSLFEALHRIYYINMVAQSMSAL